MILVDIHAALVTWLAWAGVLFASGWAVSTLCRREGDR